MILKRRRSDDDGRRSDDDDDKEEDEEVQIKRWRAKTGRVSVRTHLLT